MGYTLAVLAKAGQTVHGVIIALEDDPGIRRTLEVVPNVVFYRYEKFKLLKT